MQADLGVEYVRFHGLLNDDMSVVVPGHRKRGANAPYSIPVNDPHHPAAASTVHAPERAEKNQTCRFVEHMDFADMGANVVNATTKEECCSLCYTEPTGLPEPCVAAVFVPATNQCYFKIGDANPVLKPSDGIYACITDRRVEINSLSLRNR